MILTYKLGIPSWGYVSARQSRSFGLHSNVKIVQEVRLCLLNGLWPRTANFKV